MHLQEHSILSQISNNSQPVLAPIHGGQLSYQLYKVTKAMKQKCKRLPFASSASRVSTYFSSEAPSQIVGYTDVFKQESPRQYSVQKAPFGTSEDRFMLKLPKQPGPTTYNPPQIRSIKARAAQGVFDRTSRAKEKEDLSLIGPGTYHKNEQIDKEQLRQKLREKAKEIRQKYAREKNNKASVAMPDLSKLSKPQKQSSNKIDTSPQKQEKQQNFTNIDRFFLKQSTQKYLNQLGQSQIQMRSASSQVLSLNPNFSPQFIERKENPFTSYVQLGCSPGPGWYLRKSSTQVSVGGAKSAFSSKVSRELFEVKNEPKQKLKLSYLL